MPDRALSTFLSLLDDVLYGPVHEASSPIIAPYFPYCTERKSHCISTGIPKKRTESLREDPRTHYSKDNPITYDPREDPITEDPKKDPVTEDPRKGPITLRTLKKTRSLRSLRRTLSLRTLKRTLSMKILKRTLSSTKDCNFLGMVYDRVGDADKFSYKN